MNPQQTLNLLRVLFVTFCATIGGMAGFELGGVTGAVVVVVLAHLAVGVLKEAAAPT